MPKGEAWDGHQQHDQQYNNSNNNNYNNNNNNNYNNNNAIVPYYPPQHPENELQERTRKIFVGGLPHNTSNEDFRAYFAQFGMISDAQVMTDRDTGRPRGFGFVTFESADTVDQIIEQRHEIGGKQIELKRAEPKRQLQLSVTSKDQRERDRGHNRSNICSGDSALVITYNVCS